MPTIGQVCYSHEYCTDCPARKQCSIRPMFYSEKEYQNWRTTTFQTAQQFAQAIGFPHICIPLGLNVGLQMMDKRRKRELELHPEYSPE